MLIQLRLRIKAIKWILFTKNPIVLLFAKSENFEVGREGMEILQNIDIIHFNSSKDESVEMIYQVADNFEEQELKERYGEMHPN